MTATPRPLNTTLAVAAPGVLANDTDAEGNPLTAAKVTDPAHGTVTVSANGSISYVPTTGYTGADSFTYKANDGTVDSNTATVSLTVTAPVGTLRGSWQFDGDATDSSGQANNGSLVGSPHLRDRAASARPSRSTAPASTRACPTPTASTSPPA